MKTTGSFRLAARFMDSWNVPSSTAPSPKKETLTRPSRRIVEASAVPAASGIVAATMGTVPRMPTSGATRCIEPPRPREQPVRLP